MNRRATFPDSPPSPTATEHRDDSSRESLNEVEEQGGDFKVYDTKSAGKGNVRHQLQGPVDPSIQVLPVVVDATAMASMSPETAEETSNSHTKSTADETVAMAPQAEEPRKTGAVVDDMDSLGQAVGQIPGNDDNNSNNDNDNNSEGEAENSVEDVLEEEEDEASSSKIDPDGSMDCLSSSLQVPTSTPAETNGHENGTGNESSKDTNTSSPGAIPPSGDDDDDKAVPDAKSNEGEEEKVEMMGNKSTVAEVLVPAVASQEELDKEPRDAPSAASDLDTASETFEDKDDSSAEKELEALPPAEDFASKPKVEQTSEEASKGEDSQNGHESSFESKQPQFIEKEASGAIVRTASTAVGESNPVSEATTEMKTSLSNDSHSSAGTNSSKRPMDASGRCSLDLEVQQRATAAAAAAAAVTQDPVGDHGKQVAATTTKDATVVGNGEIGAKENQTSESLDTSVSANTLPQGRVSPMGASEKEARDAALKAATQAPPDEPIISQTQLPPRILANKDKESFGLLARGESFKNSQHQEAVQQIHHNESIGYATNHPRVPQEPDAIHKRENSSIASASRRNSMREEMNENMQRVLDDNSSRPLDDNSWRPSQVSYPSSPQGLPAPQAIPFNNGGYMMMPQHQMPQMPQHQGQPPHAFMAPPPAMLHHQSSFHSQQTTLMARPSYSYAPVPAIPPMPSPTATAPGGKRKIKLKLQEEILARPSHTRRSSFFFGARSTRKLMASAPLPEHEQINEVDRGTITVSWFEGTSSLELQEHVNKSVERKLKLGQGQQLDDIRIMDTKVDPPEEIVLCPYIPSGSEFVLRYKLKPTSGRATPTFYGPPDSPSAAPSPFPSHGNLGSLDSSQLAVLRKQLDAVQEGEKRKKGKNYRGKARSQMTPMKPFASDEPATDRRRRESRSATESDASDGDNDSDTLKPENSVDAKLRQITDLLLMDKQRAQIHRYPRVEKRQVIFVLANYFVLFVAFIMIAGEAHSRAPGWLSWMENQLENVQNCSADQEALFKCVSNGEFAGLFATVILWISRSATTKQIFLLGFDSPEKLWIVFYESLVGAFCWGFSYMFIRRGMNPDTRPRFLQRYWKDAVYGSLAGFNATFLKAVLKNLIPREAVEEAFGDRQLKILSWLPSVS